MLYPKAGYDVTFNGVPGKKYRLTIMTKEDFNVMVDKVIVMPANGTFHEAKMAGQPGWFVWPVGKTAAIMARRVQDDPMDPAIPSDKHEELIKQDQNRPDNPVTANLNPPPQ